MFGIELEHDTARVSGYIANLSPRIAAIIRMSLADQYFKTLLECAAIGQGSLIGVSRGIWKAYLHQMRGARPRERESAANVARQLPMFRTIPKDCSRSRLVDL